MRIDRRSGLSALRRNLIGQSVGMLLFSMTFSSPAWAMKFELRDVDVGGGQELVYGQGAIEAGDATRLSSMFEKRGNVERVLIVRSLGGEVAAAIELAETIKKLKLVVAVDLECASACAAVLFPAGEYSVLLKGALLGFHSCYDRDTSEVALWCNEGIARLAVENGFPHGSVRYFMDTFGPTEMRWMSEISARCFGYYRDFSDPKPIFGRKPCVDAMLALAAMDKLPMQPGNGPSFSCEKASMPLERLICLDRELMLVDRIMGRLYQAIRSKAGSHARARLLSAQRTWVAGRNRECTPLIPPDMSSFINSRAAANCISKSLQRRISDLIGEFRLISAE